MFSKKYEITEAEVKSLISMQKQCKKIDMMTEPAEPGMKSTWLLIFGSDKHGKVHSVCLHEVV